MVGFVELVKFVGFVEWLNWVRQASLVLLVRCESSPGKV